MRWVVASIMLLGFGVSAWADGQAVLDGLLMIKDPADPAVILIENVAARTLYKGISALPVLKTADPAEDCPKQWIKKGVEMNCGYCGETPKSDDDAVRYWCTLNIDMASGHVHH